MKTFYISIKCIVVFHVNMLQQLYLPVNSDICKHRKISSKTIPGNLKRRYKRSPLRLWCLELLIHCYLVYSLQRSAMSKLEVVYRRFFQFWLIFLYQKYQSQSEEYNLLWCWHHTRHQKKKRYPIFENLLKTSRIKTEVFSCLEIPLTSMGVDGFASFENSSSILVRIHR